MKRLTKKDKQSISIMLLTGGIVLTTMLVDFFSGNGALPFYFYGLLFVVSIGALSIFYKEFD